MNGFGLSFKYFLVLSEILLYFKCVYDKQDS